MMNKNTESKKKFPFFSLFMLLYVIVVLCIAYLGLGKLWNYAEEYELSRHEKTIEAFMEQLNSELWNEEMSATLSDVSNLQSEDEVQQMIKDMLSSGISYARIGSTGEDRIKYNLYCGDLNFGSVTLVPDSSVETEYGLQPWKVESHEYSFSNLYSSAEITVPANYTVEINGKKLGDEYIVESGIHFEMLDAYYGQYKGLPTMSKYKVKNILGSVETRIYDETGAEVTIDPGAGDEQFLREVNQEKWDDIANYAERFTGRYIRYTSGIGDDPKEAYESLIGFLIKGSELDERMVKAQDGLTWARGYSASVDNVDVHTVISFGDGIYFCDYSATFTVSTSTGVETSTNNYRIVIKETDGDKRTASLDTYK